ncbi:MAG TPA: Hpt domain-containing protein, partial [Candidatus Polarisedimenticolaceae bacterium]|nr:Hpt domain-containing protein [Candidatus Polarisedimenticolaceae bacterium]
MDRARYIELFLVESREHLAAAYVALGRLELAPGSDPNRRELLRHCHSLKGMAATLGFEAMLELAHALEDRLAQTGGAGGLPAPSLLGGGLECLGQIVEAVERGLDAELPRAAALARELRGSEFLAPPRRSPARGVERAQAPAPPRYRLELRLRVEAAARAAPTVGLLRRLGELGELVRVHPPQLAADSGRFEGALSLVLASRESPAALRALLEQLPAVAEVNVTEQPLEVERAGRAPEPRRWARVRADLLDEAAERAFDLVLASQRARDLEAEGGSGPFRIKALYAALEELRLVAFETLSTRLHGSVRALAAELGKELELRLHGGETRLARAQLDALGDPLLHLMRNAADHGIEPPDERAAAGKPRRGLLTLGVELCGERVRIAVEDDG